MGLLPHHTPLPHLEWAGPSGWVLSLSTLFSHMEGDIESLFPILGTEGLAPLDHHYLNKEWTWGADGYMNWP